MPARAEHRVERNRVLAVLGFRFLFVLVLRSGSNKKDVPNA